jgi:hypothetical protein
MSPPVSYPKVAMSLWKTAAEAREHRARRADVPHRARRTLVDDFVYDTLGDRRAIRIFTVVDDSTRACPLLVVDPALPAARITQSSIRAPECHSTRGVRKPRQRS